MIQKRKYSLNDLINNGAEIYVSNDHLLIKDVKYDIPYDDCLYFTHGDRLFIPIYSYRHNTVKCINCVQVRLKDHNILNDTFSIYNDLNLTSDKYEAFLELCDDHYVYTVRFNDKHATIEDWNNLSWCLSNLTYIIINSNLYKIVEHHITEFDVFNIKLIDIRNVSSFTSSIMNNK